MLLARQGYRVLRVDRATFPSDMALFTQLIGAGGVPPAPGLGAIGQGPGLTLAAGAFTLMGAPPAAAGVAKAYSPRHFVLDHILIDAAVAAGVRLRDGLSVQAVIGDGDRITGIRGRTKADSTVAEKGRLVVGADGRHSHVARSVQASESNTKPPLQGTDFTYWSGVPMEGFEFYARGYWAVYAWLKNENLARIGVNWMGKDFVRDERPACSRHGLEVLRQPLEERLIYIQSPERLQSQ